MNTLFLSPDVWDLTVDALGNIAMASDPYSLAQDAASTIRTFAGEVYFDTTQGLPYWTQILGYRPPLALIKSQMIKAATSVPEVTGAVVFFTGLVGRNLTGQVQVTTVDGGVVAASF